MTTKLYSKILLVACLFLSLEKSNAQVTTTEFFEGATANATSFTNATTGYAFTLTNKFFIENVAGYGIDPSTTPSPTIGSNKYFDNFGQTGAGQINSFKTTNGALFTLKSLWVYPSSLSDGGSPTNNGTITFNGKLNGVTKFTSIKSGPYQTTVNLGTNYNGFTKLDFSQGTDVTGILVDEVEVVLGGSFVYLAVDNLQFATAFNVWNGSSSNSWSTATNWSAGSIPAAGHSLIIPTGAANMPIQASGTLNANNITIQNSASVTLTGTLSIGGTIANSGTFTATAGSITFNGTAAQTIPASTFSTNTVQNLTINNAAGVTLGGTLNVTGAFTPTAGIFTTGGFLTLKSTSITSTAMVGIVGGSISGNVVVERYIPASQRSFRFLTPGVTTSTTIKANWQEGQNNTSQLFASNSNTVPGYGTHITGSTTGANGFDATTSGSNSMFTFSNNASQAWTGIANTSTNTFSAGQAYRILIRGSRAVNLTTNVPTISATTLRATGTLKTGTVVFNSTGTGTNVLASPTISGTTSNYSLIGNPYWAPVDWTTVTKTNVSGTYYLWDPTRAGTNNRGAYVSYTTGSGPSGGGAVNQYIQPGQAIFIQTTGASPSISFAEANKAASSANLTTTFRTNNHIDGRLNINLYLQDNYAAKQIADATSIVFSNNFTKNITDEDAEKLLNPDENISIMVNNKLLGLNAIPLPNIKDTVWLNLQNLLSSKYVLEITAEDFVTDNLEAYLIDSYLNTKTPINATATFTVNYTIDNNAASSASNRFYIVLGKTVLPTLNSSLQVNISPNPARDFITIHYAGLSDKVPTSILIVDMNGRVVKTIDAGKITTGSQILSSKGWATGMYSVQLLNGDNKQTKSIIKQ